MSKTSTPSTRQSKGPEGVSAYSDEEDVSWSQKLPAQEATRFTTVCEIPTTDHGSDSTFQRILLTHSNLPVDSPEGDADQPAVINANIPVVCPVYDVNLCVDDQDPEENLPVDAPEGVENLPDELPECRTDVPLNEKECKQIPNVITGTEPSNSVESEEMESVRR